MEQTENQAIVTFDTLYTNNHIQILKVLLPYFDIQSRKRLAILIKFMELRYTMDYFARYAALHAVEARDKTGGQPDIVAIFEQIKNFCTPSERAMFDQLANMKKSMEMYEEMMGMMQVFSQMTQETSPAGQADPDIPGEPDRPGSAGAAADSAAPQSNPIDMLKGLLSPEQQAMFEMFQTTLGS